MIQLSINSIFNRVSKLYYQYHLKFLNKCLKYEFLYLTIFITLSYSTEVIFIINYLILFYYLLYLDFQPLAHLISLSNDYKHHQILLNFYIYIDQLILLLFLHFFIKFHNNLNVNFHIMIIIIIINLYANYPPCMNQDFLYIYIFLLNFIATPSINYPVL